MICHLLKRRRRVTACRGGCNGNALSTCSCTRISQRRRIILTKTGQQHGKSTGSRSTFILSYLFTIKYNIMHISFIHPFKLNFQNEHTQIAEATFHEPLHDTSEGSEFLDDALRMEDLSFSPYKTEESVAAGSPPNLL